MVRVTPTLSLFGLSCGLSWGLLRLGLAAIGPLAAADVLTLKGVDGQPVPGPSGLVRIASGAGSALEIGLALAHVALCLACMLRRPGARERLRLLLGLEVLDGLGRGFLAPFADALPALGAFAFGRTYVDDLCCVLPGQLFGAVLLLLLTKPRP